MQPTSFFCIIIAIYFIVFTQQNLQARISPKQLVDTVQVPFSEIPEAPLQNYISVGLSPVRGGSLVGNSEVTALMYSTLIGQKLSPSVSIECGVHIFGSSRRLFSRPIIPDVELNSVVMSNLQCILTPFQEGIFVPLSVGLGFVAVWRNKTFETAYPVDITPAFNQFITEQGIYRIEDWRIGAVVMGEYAVPLNNRVILGIRGQWMPIWIKPIFEKNNIPTPSPRLREWQDRSPNQLMFLQIGSLGAFLRINF